MKKKFALLLVCCTTILASCGTSVPSSTISSAVPQSTAASVSVDASDTNQQEVLPSASSKTPAVDPNATIGEQNALRKAYSYLDFTAFSHDGLVDQLLYEGFSDQEAAYGADNCNADWNEQALKKAKDYLSMTAFSYDELIEQLEYEKFTTDEATYGVDNCGADWNEQAAIKAKQYLDMSAFSKDALIQQLEYEGFTSEQAAYGVAQNGY